MIVTSEIAKLADDSDYFFININNNIDSCWIVEYINCFYLY